MLCGEIGQRTEQHTFLTARNGAGSSFKVGRPARRLLPLRSPRAADAVSAREAHRAHQQGCAPPSAALSLCVSQKRQHLALTGCQRSSDGRKIHRRFHSNNSLMFAILNKT